METIILPINDESIKKAKEILLSGGIVGMPTETVYGLAGVGTNPNAVEEIFKVKVESVNTINVLPKRKRVGKYEGYTAAYKKAIVKLAADNKIDAFEI